MTRILKFSEAFWDVDITGTYGWDTVCKRMRDGKKTCIDIGHYFKDRAKAEAEYSKALANIARKADGKEETGVLGQGWRELKSQTEHIASIHEQAAAHFSAMAEELAKFNDEQKKLKQQTEENVKKYMQSKKNEYTKTMNLKKSYEQKCQDFNSAEENVQTLKNSVTTKKNEHEKAQKQLKSSKESMNNADTAYHSATETLESTRMRWETETENAYNFFEELEEKRLILLRDAIWRCTNVDSLACVKHDESSERVRTVLEKCDVNKDIQEFIDASQSGSKRPEKVEYENYYKAVVPQRPMIPAPSPTARAPPSRLIDIDDGGGHYASVAPAAQPSNVLLKVVKSHVPTNPSELQIRHGEILEMVKPKNAQGMITVKLRGQNRVGVVPSNCVSVQPIAYTQFTERL